MKFQLTVFYLFILFVLSINSISAQPTSYASIPYSTGFENGVLDANWYTTSSGNNGRIQIWNSSTLFWSGDTAKAHSDSLWLGLDNDPGGTYITNEAWMGLDLNGQSLVRLEFWWSEWNDESEPQDGIYISDNGGASFTKVIDLPGASYTDLQWNHFDVSLDSLNTFHGLSFTSTYVVKLQQYDNYYFAGGNDGFLFDDINVYNVVVTDVNESESFSASIYPNPTNNLVNIKLDGFYQNLGYTLTTVDGRIVKHKSNINSKEFTIDISKESRGLYLLKIHDDQSSKSYKISKE